MFKSDKVQNGKYQLFNDKKSCIVFCEKIGNSRKWLLTQVKNGNCVIKLGVFNTLSSAIEYCNKNESEIIGSDDMNHSELALNEVQNQSELIGSEAMNNQLELAVNNTQNQSESVSNNDLKVFKSVVNNGIVQKIMLNSDEFFNLIWNLNDINLIKKLCQDLLDLMSEKMAISTKSKTLTEYRKQFQKQHNDNSLNETINTKNGQNKQHIAVNLLVLSTDEKKELESKKSNQNSNFNADGSVKIVDNLKIDVSEILDIANRLLDSQNFVDIVIGLLLVTGRRGYEIATKSNNYDDLSIEKSMIILDDYRIGFKGISKKRDDCNSFFKFVTLIDSKKVFDSFKKLSNFEEYKLLINQNNKLFQNSSIRKAISRRFNYLFSDKLSSFNAYDSDGILINEDGSTHKSRAFYSIVIQSIYKKSINRDTVVNELVQKNLLHDNISETIKYLSKYDGYELINIPEIMLDSNINNLGIMTNDELELLEYIDNSDNDSSDKDDYLDYDYILDNLDSDVRKKIETMYYQGTNINEIFINMLNQKTVNIDNPDISISQDENINVNKNLSVQKNLKLIFDGIDKYNLDKSDNDDLVYPTYNLVNKLSVKLTNKQLANKTYNDYFLPIENKYLEFFSSRNIVKKDAIKWNSIKHRRDIDMIADIIISMINKG